MRGGIARLGGQETGLLRELRIIGDEHAAPRSRDDFVTVERMNPEEPMGAGARFAIACAEGFGSVFNQLHAVALTTGLDGRDVSGLTIEVD